MWIVTGIFSTTWSLHGKVMGFQWTQNNSATMLQNVDRGYVMICPLIFWVLNPMNSTIEPGTDAGFDKNKNWAGDAESFELAFG